MHVTNDLVMGLPGLRNRVVAKGRGLGLIYTETHSWTWTWDMEGTEIGLIASFLTARCLLERIWF
jgi:hypothetical protein